MSTNRLNQHICANWLWSSHTAMAKQFQIQYTDPQGNKWQRWIILDEQDRRANLLVVENPVKDISQRLVSQVIVEKSTLVNLTAGQINTKINLQLGSKKMRRPLWRLVAN